MAGTPEKPNDEEKIIPSSRSLHNFILPSQLKWGCQKHLRCVKSYRPSFSSSSFPLAATKNPNPSNPTTPLDPQKNDKNIKTDSPIRASGSGGTAEIEAIREKLLVDLKVTMDDHLKFATFEEKEKHKNEEEEKPYEEELPWNLRNRRAVNRTGNDQYSGNAGFSSLMHIRRPVDHKRQANYASASNATENQRPIFSLTLSKEEIETDFLLMTGGKPTRRPQKRSKAVQKQLDGVFPGTWLTEITFENYKVQNVHEPKGEK